MLIPLQAPSFRFRPYRLPSIADQLLRLFKLQQRSIKIFGYKQNKYTTCDIFQSPQEFNGKLLTYWAQYWVSQSSFEKGRAGVTGLLNVC